MIVDGTYTFDGPIERVWELLLDPEVMAHAMPGATRLTKSRDGHYEGRLRVKVGFIHADFDLTDWVCFQQTAPVTGEGRSFGWGHVFTREGRAVASYAQDAMVRWLKANPGKVARTSA